MDEENYNFAITENLVSRIQGSTHWALPETTGTTRKYSRSSTRYVHVCVCVHACVYMYTCMCLCVCIYAITMQSAILKCIHKLQTSVYREKSIPMIALWCPAFSNHG